MGLDPNFSFYLVSVANAGSVVGRLAGGILADRYGACIAERHRCAGRRSRLARRCHEHHGSCNVCCRRLNLRLAICHEQGRLRRCGSDLRVSEMLHRQSSFLSNNVVCSISSGVFVSMLAAPLVDMGETEDVGVRLGMFFTVLALGALAGPPISGAINEATDGFKAVGYYAGTPQSFGQNWSPTYTHPRICGDGVRCITRHRPTAGAAEALGKGLMTPFRAMRQSIFLTFSPPSYLWTHTHRHQYLARLA